MKYFLPLLGLFLCSCDFKIPNQRRGEEILADQLRDEIMDELRSERDAQKNLPQSQDPIWIKLGASQVNFSGKSGLYTLEPTEEIKSMQGQIIEVRGFIIPLDGNEMTTNFLIGVNTPVCFFHPPGEPNQVIEVISKKPIKWTTEKEIKIKGRFGLKEDKQMGVFYKIENAIEVK